MSRRLIAVALLSAALAGCGIYARKVDVRFHENYPRLPESADVELWRGTTTRPKVPIAIISSQRTADRSYEAREAQLEELKERARSLGANGIEDLRVETANVRGFVADPRVPFTAFKQGDFHLYFIRGTAVRYLQPGETSPES
jgi:uncharacterized protein YbjQ (UPF0145 family)